MKKLKVEIKFTIQLILLTVISLFVAYMLA